MRLSCFRQTQRPLEASAAVNAATPGPVDLVIIKFPGNAGRAELSPIHPANVWPKKHIVVWSINPPGYGESHGRASLDHVPAVARAVCKEVERQYPSTPILIYGNSIGALTAMRSVALTQQRQRPPRVGLLLRNPPDLRPLILDHRRQWFHGPVPKWLTRGLDPLLDSVALAAACQCPFLLVQAERDRMVPPSNQDRIFHAYPGPKAKFVVPLADHHHAPNPVDQEEYERYTFAIEQSFLQLWEPM
ncbi:MAG: hypothetical protein Q8M16_08375 [Pirellulaceae bacterium]|nr:hypothetical protein [Pirellulaceae bacterium]